MGLPNLKTEPQPSQGRSPMRIPGKSTGPSADSINRQIAINRAIQAGIPPSTVNQIFSNEMEASSVPAPVGGQVCMPAYVPLRPGEQPTVYAVSTVRADHRNYASSAGYGTPMMGHAPQAATSQYPYGAITSNGTISGYVQSSPYVYQPATMDSTGHVTVVGNGNGFHGHH